MSKIQEVFTRIQEIKRKQKDIKKTYRDALSTSHEYQEIQEKVKVLRDRKKVIEESIRSDFRSEFDKLEEYKNEINNDNMVMSDLAINGLTKGEMIEISDEYDNKYEPLFSVKFQKIK